MSPPLIISAKTSARPMRAARNAPWMMSLLLCLKSSAKLPVLLRGARAGRGCRPGGFLTCARRDGDDKGEFCVSPFACRGSSASRPVLNAPAAAKSTSSSNVMSSSPKSMPRVSRNFTSSGFLIIAHRSRTARVASRAVFTKRFPFPFPFPGDPLLGDVFPETLGVPFESGPAQPLPSRDKEYLVSASSARNASSTNLAPPPNSNSSS
mmetsp:Transcript_7937/g.29731  ORF Transcript_7937/g.29731 Transcript_7937/m.29731 type:complete len:208 (+) Transcript_7937:547-1170(+)